MKVRHGMARSRWVLVLILASIALSGCSGLKSDGVDPIEWYRDATGASKNDDQDQGRESKNLAEGSDEPYPNLATVPPPPDEASSKVDREKLAQSLIADQKNAKYTDQQLRAGQDVSASAPPPPAASAAPPPQAADAGPSAPSPAPPAKPAAANPPSPVPAAPATAAAQPKPKPKPAPPAVAANAPPPVAPNAPPPRPRRGSEAPPDETAMTPPTARPMPQGDALRRAPPPPIGAGVPRQQVAAAEPARSDAEAAAPRRAAVTVQAAEIGFTPGPFRAKILPADRAQLAEVAKMALQNNARVRVVGYGGAPLRGDLTQREFQSFDAALDNAKAVAIALTGMGVPPNRIDVDTIASVDARDRAEVFIEYP